MHNVSSKARRLFKLPAKYIQPLAPSPSLPGSVYNSLSTLTFLLCKNKCWHAPNIGGKRKTEKGGGRVEEKGSKGMRIWDSNWVSNCGSESVELTLPCRALSMDRNLYLSFASHLPHSFSLTLQVASGNWQCECCAWKWNLK